MVLRHRHHVSKRRVFVAAAIAVLWVLLIYRSNASTGGCIPGDGSDCENSPAYVAK